MAPSDLMAAFAVVLFWGLNFVVAKIGLEQFPPLLMMATRFGVVALVLAPFLRWPSGRLRMLMAYAFTLGLVHFALMFTGLAHADVAVAAIAIQIQVPFSALLAALFFSDRIGWRQASGMAVAITGVVVLAGEPREGTELWAVVLIVGAAMAFAVSNLQMKALSDLSPAMVNGWLALLATPQLLLASLVLESGQWNALTSADWRGWGSVAYQSIVVVVLCYSLWYRLLRRYPVTQVVPLTLLIPVFGVIGGVFLLDEPVSLQLAIGGALTLAGVAIILLRRPRLVEQTRSTT